MKKVRTNCIRLVIVVPLLTILLSSCHRDPIAVSKKEYHENKHDGFWNIRNRKAIRYNQHVAKPKLNRQVKRLAAENRRIERKNIKQNKRFANNEELLKAFDHH